MDKWRQIGDLNCILIILIRLSISFHTTKYFSQNRTPVLQLLDYIEFPDCQKKKKEMRNSYTVFWLYFLCYCITLKLMIRESSLCAVFLGCVD